MTEGASKMPPFAYQLMLTLGSFTGPKSFQLTLKCGSFGLGMLILMPPKAFMILLGMLEIAFHALSMGF